MSDAKSKTLAVLREGIQRLQNQLTRAESRNADLRSQLEMAALGKVKAWTPFQQCDTAVGPDGKVHEISNAAATVWRNNLYTVTRWERPFIENVAEPGIELSIKRNDGAAIRDWRHFQRIKNELCGPEREGVEIYPAESRLVDGANQFWIFVMPEGGRVPFGFKERLVSSNQGNGVQQRQWEPGAEPADLRHVSVEAMSAAIHSRGILGPGE